MDLNDEHRITSVEELRAINGSPGGLAGRKVMPRIDRHARDFIERSPLLCLSSADAGGRADVTPRGDRPGFVQVLDDRTVAIPERPGNQRMDTMVNILSSPSVGVLFFVPGFDDMLRINGKAWITRAPAILEAATVSGKVPKLAICVHAEEVFFHCAKALKRSRIWDASTHLDRRTMPSLARIILEQVGDGCADDAEVAAHEARHEEAYRTKLY